MLGHEGRMCFAGDLDLLLPSNMEIRIYISRSAQLAELPRSKLFSYSPYAKFFETFATEVPYLTFCDKIFDIGNG